MEGPPGKTLTLEERKMVKEKLAVLKKEYNQTIRRLQRSQKAERVKIHVKKTIEEQNRFLSQQETEVSPTDSKSAAFVSWQTSVGGSDVDTQRRTAVTFNLEPEVFCIGDRLGTSPLPGSDSDGQQSKCTGDKVLERSQRSRLKLKRSTSALKRKESDIMSLSRETSLLSGTPCLPVCLSNQEVELQTLGSSVSEGSTLPPNLDQKSAEDSARGVGKHDIEDFTSQLPSLNGCFPEPQKPIIRSEETDSLSVDLSTASLESTPSLFISPTPDPLKNRKEAEPSSFSLDREEHEIGGLALELGSYFCFSNNPKKDDAMESPVSAARQPCIKEQPILSQSRLPSSCSPVADASVQAIGIETGDVTLTPECVPSSVTTESPLNSCTLVDGLLFPVEYYVRTTRRMSSFQRKVDLDAVIQSHLRTNRKTSRTKVKHLHADPDNVDIDSANQKGLLKKDELLLPDADKNCACSPGNAKACIDTNSQTTSPTYVPMTQIGTISSGKKGRGRGRAPWQDRRKSRSTGKFQIDVELAAIDSDKMANPTQQGLKNDSQNEKEHLCKTTELLHLSCTSATGNARHQEVSPPAYNSNIDNTREMIKPVERTPAHRNSFTLRTEKPADDLIDFETDLNVHRTPKRRAECVASRTRSPRTPLHLATQHLMAAESSPQPNTPLSCLQRKKGKAASGQKSCHLKESQQGAENPFSVELTAPVWNSLFHSPDERFSVKRLPVTLGIQDFHLPDEEFGFLKLEKLKSCCVPPLEQFVCPVSEEDSQANEVESEGPALATKFSNQLSMVSSENDATEIETENQTLASNHGLVDGDTFREPEVESITNETFGQKKTIMEETNEQSYTVSSNEAFIREKTTLIELESNSCLGIPLGGRPSIVSKPVSTEGNLGAKETPLITCEDKSCRSLASVEELPNAQNYGDKLYAVKQSFIKGDALKELKESSDQLSCSHDLTGEHVAVQECSQPPSTDGELLEKQIYNLEEICKPLNAECEVQDDDLAFFGISLDELPGSAQWQEPFPQVQHNQKPFSIHLLSTPLASVLPDADYCNEVPSCTPALPTLGPTPALCISTRNPTPSSDIGTSVLQTVAFCSQKPEENDAFVCTLENRNCVTRSTSSLGEESATVELCSQKTDLKLKALRETNGLNSEKRPIWSETGLNSEKRPIWSETGLSEASELPSQMRRLEPESEQCETRLDENSKSQRAVFSEQAWNESTEPGDYNREPVRSYKTNCHRAAKKNEQMEMPPSAKLCEWPERILDGGLQLLSQIQPAGSCSCAVDLSTVWWEIDGWKEMCTVIATESTVSLWKPLDGGKWEIAYSWNAPEIPIMQLIPLPDDCNFLCVALGKLDIEEIWALSSSPHSSGLSALLVKHGYALVVRGLSGRRLVCSSGRQPNQVVEVLFLSEVGRSFDTRSMWPPGDMVLSFAEVEGEKNALVGTTSANNAVIWNSSSGQLLKMIPIENCHQPSLCLQAYSELGLLFIVLSHPPIHANENSGRSVLSLIAVNPKEALSVHVMSYMLPKDCSGRYLEGDLKDNTAAAVLTTGNIVLWDLHLGHCTALLPASPHAEWSLVRWCQVDSHLLTGQKDGSVSVYKYFESCGEKT